MQKRIERAGRFYGINPWVAATLGIVVGALHFLFTTVAFHTLAHWWISVLVAIGFTLVSATKQASRQRKVKPKA